MKRLILFAIALLFSAGTAFYYSTPSQVTAADNPANTLATVCFERDVLPLFVSNCAQAGCHDAITRSQGYNLTSYATIKPYASKCYSQMKNGSMPYYPYGKMLASQIATVNTWITEGTLNNTCPPTSCDSVKVTYAGNIKQIIQTECLGCHNGSSAGGGISFATDALIQAKSTDILLSINGFPKPMPPYGFTMNYCFKAQIKTWDSLLNNPPDGILQSEILPTYELKTLVNPAIDRATLEYSIAKDGFISLEVFDTQGRKVSTLVNNFTTAGTFQAEFDANVSGVYYCRLAAGEVVKMSKIIIQK